MSRPTRVLALLALLAFTAGGAAVASGYSVYEQGAKAMAMAGAFTARADDPSALFFNPAGITQLEGLQVYGGTTAVLLQGSSFQSALSGNEYDQVGMIAWPSTLYVTQSFKGKNYAWGFGLTSPFGLKTQWDEEFEGRFISRESNLAVVDLNANFAWKMGAKWSAAIGLDYAKADVRELSHNIDLSPFGGPFVGQEAFTQLSGDGNDTGWNAALRWASPKGWSWGASYRSRMDPEVEGEVEFEDIPGALAAFFPNGGATAVIPLPATLALGGAYKSHLGRGNWEMEFDLVWTDWSVFDDLEIDIENNTAAVTDVSQTEEWNDTVSYRLGYAYHLSTHQEWRAGLYLDRNPIPDDHVRPRLPDADRWSVQAGYGFRADNGFYVDAAYQALLFDDRDATGDPTSTTDPVLPGTYTNLTHLVGVSLGWKF